MKKLGIGRKEKGYEGDDPNRGRLFGSKSSKSSGSSPAPPSANPYAVPQYNASPDPYSQPTQGYQRSGGYGGMSQPSYNPPPGPSQPPSYGPQSGYGGYSGDRFRDEKSPIPAGGYGGSRYGSQGNYGSQQGYGSDPFGSASGQYQNAPNAAPQRSGGYGGLAPPGGYDARPSGYGGIARSRSQETMETQAGRDALFGGARERYEQKAANNGLPPDEDPAKGYGSGGATGVPDMGYGTYQERQLTAEEQEEEDIQSTKQQIRAIKQQDVSSTRNALRIAEEAEQTGRETLERLGAQGERLHNTEKNLDLASHQNRLAEEKARELKTLNRSMWAMHVGNPFTKSRRDREREDEIIETHESERAQREATRAAAYASQTRQQQAQKDLRGSGPGAKKGTLAERSKYQFEADSEDEAMEDEIDQNLDLLGGAAGRLNQLSRAMGKEVEAQNKTIDTITGKADQVDTEIVVNRSRIDRIK